MSNFEFKKTQKAVVGGLISALGVAVTGVTSGDHWLTIVLSALAAGLAGYSGVYFTTNDVNVPQEKQQQNVPETAALEGNDRDAAYTNQG